MMFTFVTYQSATSKLIHSTPYFHDPTVATPPSQCVQVHSYATLALVILSLADGRSWTVFRQIFAELQKCPPPFPSLGPRDRNKTSFRKAPR